MRTVGILGGMGPGATILLMQKVMALVPATDDADHVPLLVHQNPQVPSRLSYLLDGQGEDPGPVLEAMARTLAAAGAQALAMPCNTAHHWIDRVTAAGLPVLDMLALAAEEARALGADRVGLLASPAVRRVGLFERVFAGLTVVHPEPEAPLVAAIRSIKADGPTEPARAALRAASADLLASGATVQVLACTEFSLIPEAVAPGARTLDALDALARGIVAFARGDAASRPAVPAPGSATMASGGRP